MEIGQAMDANKFRDEMKDSPCLHRKMRAAMYYFSLTEWLITATTKHHLLLCCFCSLLLLLHRVCSSPSSPHLPTKLYVTAKRNKKKKQKKVNYREIWTRAYTNRKSGLFTKKPSSLSPCMFGGLPDMNQVDISRFFCVESKLRTHIVELTDIT